MRRRDFITLIGGAIATWPALAHGQQNRKPWRIGIPADIPPSAATTRRFGALRDGLKELGYDEGSNIVIDYRDADGSRDGLIALCKDMIASGADVIVAGSTNAALPAQITTKPVPIVMRAAADPVAVGLVESLARPGGNITGVTSLAADLSAKRLDVLKEFLPQLQRVAVIWEPNSAAGRDSMRETEMAARALRIDVEGFGVNRGPRLNSPVSFNPLPQGGLTPSMSWQARSLLAIGRVSSPSLAKLEYLTFIRSVRLSKPEAYCPMVRTSSVSFIEWHITSTG